MIAGLYKQQSRRAQERTLVGFDLHSETEPKVRSTYVERKYAKDKIGSFKANGNRKTEAH